MLGIIIPYYKLEFFEATLQSLANQTDKRFNVYIGDDASPKDCSVLLKQYEGKFEFVYHRFETNLGSVSLTQQWERCISLSNQEEWLMILGDDDVLGENVVEQFYKNINLLNLENSNVLKFATVNINCLGIEISKIYLNPFMESAESAYYRKYIWESRSSLSEYIFRKSIYEKCRFKNYPLAWHSDDKAWLDFSQNYPILANNNAIVKIRISNENISGMENNFELKNKAKRMFFKDFCKDNLKKYPIEHRVFWLFEFGDFIKKSSYKEINLVFFIFIKFFTNFRFIDAFKFLRRMYWIK